GLMGREHAAALLEIGGRVVLSDINEKGLRRVASNLARAYDKRRLMTCVMDVTSPDSIKSARLFVEKNWAPIDVLINNAAIDPKVERGSTVLERSRLEHFSRDQWDVEIAVGLTGAFLCAQQFGSAMARRGQGTILNIASDLSVIAPDQRLYRKP